MRYLSYIFSILVFSLFISCSTYKDLYIAPNFVSDNSLPAKPVFTEQNPEYFSLDYLTFKINLNRSLKNQSNNTLNHKYASLSQFNYQFALPFYYDNFLFFYNRFYPDWVSHYQSNLYKPVYLNGYHSFGDYWVTSYHGVGHCIFANTQRKIVYVKPSPPSSKEKSNVHYNLARTSNYNYTTRKRTKTSSGYYNDPKTIPSPVITQVQTHEYTPYSYGPSKNSGYPPKRNSASTYNLKKPKPQATPTSITPSSHPPIPTNKNQLRYRLTHCYSRSSTNYLPLT